VPDLSTNVGAEEPDEGDFVVVRYPRELVEREFMMDLMALRDERVRAGLPAEVLERLGDDPVAGIPFLTTRELAGMGSISNGTFCHGIKSFSAGVICKILKIPNPS